MPSITNKIENFDLLTKQELATSRGLPKSGTYLIHPKRVLLSNPVEINSKITRELSVFAEFDWIHVNVFNLNLPIVRAIGIKDYDHIYEVLRGHDVIAASIHLKIKLISVILLRDEHIHQLQANGVLGGE